METRISISGNMSAYPVNNGQIGESGVNLPRGDYTVSPLDELRSNQIVLQSIREASRIFVSTIEALKKGKALGLVRVIPEQSFPAAASNQLSETLDGLLSGGLTISEAVTLVEKGGKKKVGYWRTIAGRKIGFSGKPGHGKPIAGHRATLNKLRKKKK